MRCGKSREKQILVTGARARIFSRQLERLERVQGGAFEPVRGLRVTGLIELRRGTRKARRSMASQLCASGSKGTPRPQAQRRLSGARKKP